MKLGDLKRIFKADNHPNVINNMMNQEEITIELEFLLDNFRLYMDSLSKIIKPMLILLIVYSALAIIKLNTEKTKKEIRLKIE